MSSPFSLLDSDHSQQGQSWRRYVFPLCIGTTCILVMLELLVMIIIASHVSIVMADLTPMTAEVRTTLQNVQVVLPEMRTTVHMLGQLVPEITEGMKILQQLCQHDPQCTI